MIALAPLAALALLAGQASAADPHRPAPVMDIVAPAVPKLRPGAVLVLTKTNGWRDEAQIVAAVPALTRIVGAQHHDVFATENAAVMNPADLARFRVVVLASTSGDIFSPAQRAAFRAWVERGGGVVLLHGAGGDPEYAWDWYRDTLLGAQFIGHTWAPRQFREGRIDIVAPNHPAMRGLPRHWKRTEEWYAFDRVPTGHDTQILATLDEASYDPDPKQRMGRHPIVWTRRIGQGRMIFSALGHLPETYAEPLHLKLIANAIAWAGNGKAAR